MLTHMKFSENGILACDIPLRTSIEINEDNLGNLSSGSSSVALSSGERAFTPSTTFDSGAASATFKLETGARRERKPSVTERAALIGERSAGKDMTVDATIVVVDT